MNWASLASCPDLMTFRTAESSGEAQVITRDNSSLDCCSKGFSVDRRGFWISVEDGCGCEMPPR